MATYADLKQSIISDMDRDDLEDDLADKLDEHVRRACEFYAAERFWFNARRTTATTTNGTATVAIPATVRVPERVSRNDVDLIKIDLEEYPEDGATGEPEKWASYNGNILLYPTPNASYTLDVTGESAVDAPQADADDNIWTNEASALIAARTRMTLCRRVFRDTEGMVTAMADVAEELARLKRETSRRLKAPMRTEIAHLRRPYI